MLKSLRISHLLLLLLLLLGMHASQASHFLGGQLTYTAVAGVPNRYKFTLRVYRDCSGAALYTTATFKFRSGGCVAASGDPADIVAPLVGGSTIGSDYCATAVGGASPCGVGLPTNYETGRYEVEITLPPRAEWRISATDNARPETANIVGQDNIYYEAVLRNSLAGQVITNNSASFATIQTQFVGYNLNTTFSHLAVDADGDSLVYSLVQPLGNCNDPLAYKNIGIGTQGYIDISAGGPPCLASLTGGNVYTPTFPLASYNFTGSCPVKTAVPYFLFDSAMGSMSFKPILYNPGNTTADQATNKYVVVVKVDEYRRLNGTYTLVGSTRRDMMFIVVDCGTNQNPTLAPLRINNSSATTPINTVIPVTAGQLVNLQLAGTDANNTQIVTMTSNAEQVLPNADFVASGPSAQPTAVLNWLPPANLRPGLYYCTVTTTDNACPIKGTTQQTLTFRVTNTTLATKNARNATPLAAVPTPFRGHVSFTLAQPGVQTVQIFDRLGRQVAELKSRPTGEVVWQPGTEVAAGLYLARSSDGRQVARLLRTDAE
ncbi:hypothetical protein J0X19_02905 [Hymenobacter sp. BT186]|uniref:T9SS type A sorting domain-containing protein n=1 Tax=Hymenobacter telluris TaxID=2816474 RepID=A0A939ESY4_9BACT|nr:hypothetical protein [Hymenobacter telluris]MBO0356883.1 hypothetical protein [Hymenobacter telluris]MBW3372910.1 hypothetical protein [Hymenobacter norwichensis]